MGSVAAIFLQLLAVMLAGINAETWTYEEPNTAVKYDFTLVRQESTWTQAKDACTSRGARLAKPDTEGKNYFLMEKLRATKGFTSNGAWFGGGRDPKNVNQWLFTDGSRITFTSWASGEPNHAHEKCTEFWRHGNYLWNDETCHIRKPFICEAPYEDIVTKDLEANIIYIQQELSENRLLSSKLTNDKEFVEEELKRSRVRRAVVSRMTRRKSKTNRLRNEELLKMRVYLDNLYKRIQVLHERSVGLIEELDKLDRHYEFLQGLQERQLNFLHHLEDYSVQQGTKVKEIISNIETGIRNLTDTANGLQNARVVAGKAQITKSIQSSIQASQQAFQAADKDLDDIVNAIHKELAQNQQNTSEVTKDLKDTERKFQAQSAEIAALGQQIVNQQKLLDQAKKEEEQAEAEKTRAEQAYANARRDQKHWKEVCLATSWIPGVNIGTCVKSLVEDADLRSSTAKYKSAKDRYKRRHDIMRSMHSRKFKMSDSFEKTKERLKEAGIKKRVLDSLQRILHSSQEQLAQLGTNVKVMLGKTHEIVTASRTFTHGEEVKTLMKSLGIAMENTINAITSGHKTLGIKAADLQRLKAAGDAFIRKVDELTTADQDLLGFDDF